MHSTQNAVEGLAARRRRLRNAKLAETQQAVPRSLTSQTSQQRVELSRPTSQQSSTASAAVAITESGSTLGDDEHEFEAIRDIGARGGEMGCTIKWKGYTEFDNTWEPIRNCSSIMRQLGEHCVTVLGRTFPDVVREFEDRLVKAAPPPKRKRGRTADVHEFFEDDYVCNCQEKCPPNTRHSKCVFNECPWKQRFHNTTNLRNHLWAEHQGAIAGPKVKVEKFSKEWAAHVTETMCRFLHESCNPPNMIQHHRFRQLMSEASEERYDVPSAVSLKPVIRRLHGIAMNAARMVVAKNRERGIRTPVLLDAWSCHGQALLAIIATVIVPFKNTFAMREVVLTAAPCSNVSFDFNIN
eukprot:GHVU01057503.1.p1 GENE.GHVU01057503.1~~GHVU01057503.1.p1  ORF type:complete len:354 (-),score=35.09 GHVU01057503.1:537-1598(-)